MGTKRRAKRVEEPAAPNWSLKVKETEGRKLAYGRVRVGNSQEWCSVIYDVTELVPIAARAPSPAHISEAQSIDALMLMADKWTGGR